MVVTASLITVVEFVENLDMEHITVDLGQEVLVLITPFLVTEKLERNPSVTIHVEVVIKTQPIRGNEV